MPNKRLGQSKPVWRALNEGEAPGPNWTMTRELPIPCKCLKELAGTTGLEPAASAVTGQRSNQLNYVPTRQINEMRNKQCLCGFAQFAYRARSCLRCPKERDSCPNRPQTASNFRHFRALLRFPKQSAQNAPGDPEFNQSGQNHQQNFRKSLSQKYPNSFSQNTKDHLHFPIAWRPLLGRYTVCRWCAVRQSLAV